MSDTMFEKSLLWDRTLGAAAIASNSAAEHHILRLRGAFLRFRANASHLAQQISADLRKLTVHDISHIDALWDVASILFGSDFTFNPLEGFLLGATFLLHDLGLALCAYPRGVAELCDDARWLDIVAQKIANRDGLMPIVINRDVIPADIASDATEAMLRLLHAERAALLPSQAFTVGCNSGHVLYLIEDQELRLHFAEVLGQLSYSHWWGVDQVERKFSRRVGGLPGLPGDWDVDLLKLALALRVTDACHIDSRRAPALLRALLRPDGYAELHWTAQQHLLAPRRERERLEFTAAAPFKKEETKAWWIAYELATLADRELRSANEVLQRTQRQQFTARWVSGVDTPENFCRHVPTVGWVPVDTRLRVGDVPSLVSSLGGRNLYGSDGTVPLRELLQNARDAVVARRLLEKRPNDWGEIIVRQGQSDQQHWIEVEDSGKGMSRELLTGAFLDFGGSYWESRLAASECPGLFASGFNPAGRFGIGFFSVFMWGERVTVRTRTPADGRQDTRVLEFNNGPAEPPILRAATSDEHLNDAGTTVRVWLAGRPDAVGGPLAKGTPLYSGISEHGPKRMTAWVLNEVCEWLCPALDVTLKVEVGGSRSAVVDSSDWLTLDASEFLRRLHIGFDPTFSNLFESNYFAELSSRVQVLHDDHGRVVGRAAIMPLHSPSGDRPVVQVVDGSFVNAQEPFPRPTLVLTAGPFRAETRRGMAMCGVLIGRPSEATRHKAVVVGARGGAIGDWATQQGQLLSQTTSSVYELSDVATIIQGCGGRPLRLPIARDGHRFLTAEDIALMESPPNCVELFDEVWDTKSYPFWRHSLDKPCQYGVDRLSMQSAVIPFRDPKCSYRGPKHNPVWMRFRHSLLAANVEAWAARWGASIDDVLKCSTIDIPATGRPDVSVPVVLRNPNQH